MKKLIIVVFVAATPLAVLRAEGPIDTAANVAHGAVDTAKNVGHSVVRGTKRVVHRIADAVTPESGFTAVNVTVSDRDIEMPRAISSGKTAFIVHNVGRHTHNFEIEGADENYEFEHAVRPGQTKVLNVSLGHGTYSARSTGSNATARTLTVR